MKNRHILLAEDDPHDAQMILAVLEEQNRANKVFVVHDGEEVLDYLYGRGKFHSREEGNPVAILLDLKMPKIDGLEALKIIKSDEHLKNVPVVMLTSSRETADLKECYRNGVNAYVVKPVDLADFAKVIQQLGFFWTTINEPPPEPKKRETPIPVGEPKKEIQK
jgi:CheY-like chemotaxis protein